MLDSGIVTAQRSVSAAGREADRLLEPVVRRRLPTTSVAKPSVEISRERLQGLEPVVVVRLAQPITVVLVGDGAGVDQMLRQRRYRRPACHARAEQLEINLQAPACHPPRSVGQATMCCRPRRERPVRPHAAADALALKHTDLAETIAGNFARRTVHPREDLLQLAMIGLIKAARRYDPSRGPFRPYGRTYANGEITHFLRDNGFLLKVPPTWREIHARGQRLLSSGVCVRDMTDRLGISLDHWERIFEACSVKVVGFPVQ